MNLKKILILGAVLTLTAGTATGQCRYEKNGKDEFTGEIIRQTKPATLFTKWSVAANASAKKVDTSCYLVFNYAVSSKTKDQFRVDEGAELMLLLQDGSVVKMKAVESISAYCADKPDALNNYQASLNNCTYYINKEDIDKIRNSPVSKIRFNYVAGNNATMQEDIEIKGSANQERLQGLLQCVI